MRSIYLFLVGASIIFGSTVSLAQNFEVAPIQLNFSSNPGETQTKIITVKNHGNQKISVVLSFQDYLIYKDGERKMLSAGSSKNSIAEWINLNPSYLEINPNQAQTVELTFQAPNDDYRSRWGVLNFTTTKEQTAFQADRELTTGMSIYGRINVDLSYTPASNNNQRVQISNLKETTTASDSIRKFNVNIDNLGNTITECKVYLIASNLSTDRKSVV